MLLPFAFMTFQNVKPEAGEEQGLERLVCEVKRESLWPTLGFDPQIGSWVLGEVSGFMVRRGGVQGVGGLGMRRVEGSGVWG